MLKWVLWGLILGLGALWITRSWRAGAAARRPDPPASPPASPPVPAVMAVCARCGVHLPQREAVHDAAGRPYCSDAHRLSGPARPPSGG